MNAFFQNTVEIFKKELKSEFRTKYVLNSLLMFVLICVSVIRFAAGDEKIDNEISVEVKQLEAAIDRSKDKELDKQKEEIKRLLYQELLLRYGYRNAFYDYVSSKYSDVSKAMQLVNTPAEYNKILKKKIYK